VIKKNKNLIHKILIQLSIFSEYILLKFNENLFCFLFNLRANLRGWDVTLSYNKETKKYKAESDNLCREFVHKELGNYSYKKGLRARAYDLMEVYLFKYIKFNHNDVVIDCGANVGDLDLIFKITKTNVNYIAIEPSLIEYNCLVENVKPFKAENYGLWNEEKQIEFYISSEKADSSIIEPAHFDKIVTLQVYRLDALNIINKIDRIKLLKIEAEGAEPEVLLGALGVLQKIDYISVDCGFERGKKCESTLASVINFSLNNGFEIVDIYYARLVVLLKNKTIQQ
jgi:FkbM family methyltransferase